MEVFEMLSVMLMTMVVFSITKWRAPNAISPDRLPDWKYQSMTLVRAKEAKILRDEIDELERERLEVETDLIEAKTDLIEIRARR